MTVLTDWVFTVPHRVTEGCKGLQYCDRYPLVGPYLGYLGLALVLYICTGFEGGKGQWHVRFSS